MNPEESITDYFGTIYRAFEPDQEERSEWNILPGSSQEGDMVPALVNLEVNNTYSFYHGLLMINITSTNFQITDLTVEGNTAEFELYPTYHPDYDEGTLGWVDIDFTSNLPEESQVAHVKYKGMLLATVNVTIME